MIININGKIVPSSEAKISIFDRGFLFGDSVYEVLRTYNHIPFLLQEHLDRLQNSANIIALPINYSLKELKQILHTTLQHFWQKTPQYEAYIRLIITRGEGGLTLDPTEQIKNNLIIIIKPQLPNPPQWYTEGVKFIIAENQKTPKQTIDPNCKSGNHLPHVLALQQARMRGAFDAIMLNQYGMITEGTSNNIWIVKDKIIMTPPLQSGILEGLTRKTIINILQEQQIPFKQTALYPQDAYQAEECFFTSSTREIVPIVEIDGYKIGTGKPGPVYQRLHKLYHQFISNYRTV